MSSLPAEEIRSFLTMLVPPGFRLTLENLGTEAGTAVAAPAPMLALTEHAPVAAPVVATDGKHTAGLAGDVDHATPLGIVRRIAAEQPMLELTAAAWAKKLRYSARELTKARNTSGALPCRRRGKGGGKAGRALVIKASDVEKYLQTMRDIAMGLVDPPAWYGDVSDQRKTR